MPLNLKDGDLIFTKFKYLVGNKPHYLNLSFKVYSRGDIDPKHFLNLVKEKFLKNLFFTILSPQITPEFISFSANSQFGRDAEIPAIPTIPSKFGEKIDNKHYLKISIFEVNKAIPQTVNIYGIRENLNFNIILENLKEVIFPEIVLSKDNLNGAAEDKLGTSGKGDIKICFAGFRDSGSIVNIQDILSFGLKKYKYSNYE
uniref:Uncharacterized protein n=1 Tax=Caulerpa manorensis TaxID=717648 RepID=A0A2P0QI99_9CHLO|nr:hypothetical protein [Caulerpa manorensis]ARO74487.1 hypothetical protein [Caulerpa manorensis]